MLWGAATPDQRGDFLPKIFPCRPAHLLPSWSRHRGRFLAWCLTAILALTLVHKPRLAQHGPQVTMMAFPHTAIVVCSLHLVLAIAVPTRAQPLQGKDENTSVSLRCFVVECYRADQSQRAWSAQQLVETFVKTHVGYVLRNYAVENDAAAAKRLKQLCRHFKIEQPPVLAYCGATPIVVGDNAADARARAARCLHPDRICSQWMSALRSREGVAAQTYCGIPVPPRAIPRHRRRPVTQPRSSTPWPSAMARPRLACRRFTCATNCMSASSMIARLEPACALC